MQNSRTMFHSIKFSQTRTSKPATLKVSKIPTLRKTHKAPNSSWSKPLTASYVRLMNKFEFGFQLSHTNEAAF